MGLGSYIKKKASQYDAYERKELARRREAKAKKLGKDMDKFYDTRKKSGETKLKRYKRRLVAAGRRYPAVSGFGKNPNRSLRNFSVKGLRRKPVQKFVVRRKKLQGG